MDNGLSSLGFKRKTYIEILEDMEAGARELFGDNINLSERSPMGLILQSVAWEISLAWEEIENSYYNGSALNAVGLALDDVVNNFGRHRFDGVKARGNIRIIGDEGTIIPIGFIVGTRGGLLFETIENVAIPVEEEIIVNIQAKEIGIEYNVPASTITEIINPFAGIREVANEEPTTGGANVEGDTSLRIRHLGALRDPATGDNVPQYRIWAREVKGVGNVKILPTTPSKGYVTIVITGSNNQPADGELISNVEAYIHSVRPVNAGIVVETANTKEIDIGASVSLVEGYTIENIKNEFTDRIKNYFMKISLAEDYVSYGQIGRLLLDIRGVIDYENLTINSNVANVVLNNTEVPTIGDVIIEEV